MPEILNKITLGVDSATAREFFVRGPVAEGPISDFAAQVRIGEASYDARLGAGFVVLETFHGGGGVLEAKVREDLGRWAWNTGADVRIPGVLARPLASAAGTVGSNTVMYDAFPRRRQQRGIFFARSITNPADKGARAIKIIGDRIYAMFGLLGSSWTELSYSGSGAPLGGPTTFVPAVGANAGLSHLAIADGTSAFVSTTAGVAGGFSAGSLMPGGRSAYDVLGYGEFLLILLDNGTVIYSSDGINFVTDSGGSNEDILWYLPVDGEFMGVFRSPWGDAAPYYLSNDGTIYVLHFHARKFFKVPLPVQGIACWSDFEDGFVVSDGHRVSQAILAGDQILIRDMPIFPDQGMPVGENWMVAALCDSPDGRLYAQLYKGLTGEGWIFEWNGSAWNPFGKPQVIGGTPKGLSIIDTSQVVPGFDSSIYAWQFGRTSPFSASLPTAYRTKGPTNARNPLTDSSYAYDTSDGSVETPWMDMGFRELDGAMFEVWYGGDLPAGATILVEYALDGSAVFTTLGTFTAALDPPRLRFSTPDPSTAIPGTEFRRLKIKITPKGTGATVATNALPLTLAYRKKPQERLGFNVTIDAAHMISHPAGVSGWSTPDMEEIADYLRTLWNTKTQLYFAFADRTTTRVNLVNYTILHQQIRSGQRTGRIPLQLEEAVEGA